MKLDDLKREIIITLRADGSPSAWEFSVLRRFLNDDGSEFAQPQALRTPATIEDVRAVLDHGALAVSEEAQRLNLQIAAEREAAKAEKDGAVAAERAEREAAVAEKDREIAGLRAAQTAALAAERARVDDQIAAMRANPTQ